MNTYKITFQRENGTTGTDRFVAATEAQARRDFRECYRHENYTITSAEMVVDNAPATKEQERKALAKIRKIVEELGPGSYIGTAFEGCFEIAESNIENDFACSMKQRWEAIEKECKAVALERDDAQNAAIAAQNELEQKCQELAECQKHLISSTDLFAIHELISLEISNLKKDAETAAANIVEYASNPDSPEFKQAVNAHRKSISDKTFYCEIEKRIEMFQIYPFAKFMIHLINC